MIANLHGKKKDEICNYSSERLGKDSAYMLDSTKLREELNWSDRIDLEEGLDRVMSWVDEHLHVISKLSKEYEHKA